MKKNKKKSFSFIFFILFLVLISSFFIFEFKLKKNNKPEKTEGPKSAAIYCQIEKLSKSENEENATSTGQNFSITDERIIKQCFHIDENGIVFKEAPIISGGPFLVIYDKTRQDLKISKQVIQIEILKNILEIKNKINLSLLNFTIISPISADLEILTSGGWKIYFDASKDIGEQIDALNKILKQEIKPKEYIDLRIDNRAYYK